MKLWFARIGLICSLLLVALGLQAEEKPKYIPSIIEFEDRNTLSQLESGGVIVWRVRDDMALVLIPYQEYDEKVRKIRNIHGVRALEKGKKATPSMDVARTHFGADALEEGRNLPQPYTGRGVVVGFCDIGFDPSHPNFYDEQGNCRISRLVAYDEAQGIRNQMDNAIEIRRWSTDDKSQFHATHVAGILAGSCRNPDFHGMAPEAEIVATTSTLYDVGLLMGVEDVIDYAREKGMPAVVNLSMGSFTGPRDGSTLFNKYIASLGRDAIICMSAGNNGADTSSVRLDFSDTFCKWRGRLYSTDWLHLKVAGTTEIWSDDNRPTAISMLVYDSVEGKEVAKCDIPSDSDGSFNYYLDIKNHPEFAQFFKGYVDLSGDVSPRNNRFCARLEYNISTTEKAPGQPWARYNIAFEVRGAPGVSAWLTSDAGSSMVVRWPGYKDTGAELSISDLVAGQNVISVGMYTNRNSWPILDGSIHTENFQEMAVSPFSSYGTLFDGTILPHTVAPGFGMISSFSSYYLDMNPGRVKDMSASVNYHGRTYYFGNESGTSMSSPYVAGCIACWLEANPNLTFNDVLATIEATNRHDYPDPDNPRHGRGWFDALAGLKYILLDSSISSNISSSHPSMLFTGSEIEIYNPSAGDFSLHIYNLEGIEAIAAVNDNASFSVQNVGALMPGVYIASLSSATTQPEILKFRIK